MISLCGQGGGCFLPVVAFWESSSARLASAGSVCGQVSSSEDTKVSFGEGEGTGVGDGIGEGIGEGEGDGALRDALLSACSVHCSPHALCMTSLFCPVMQRICAILIVIIEPS